MAERRVIRPSAFAVGCIGAIIAIFLAPTACAAFVWKTTAVPFWILFPLLAVVAMYAASVRIVLDGETLHYRTLFHGSHRIPLRSVTRAKVERSDPTKDARRDLARAPDRIAIEYDDGAGPRSIDINLRLIDDADAQAIRDFLGI